MSTRDHLTEVGTKGLLERPRFARYGRLAPYPGAPSAEQVRCECDQCGTHLLAAARPAGGVDGSCPVCLSRRVTPVAVHRATA